MTRAIDCPCGHRLEGKDDEELVRKAREHIEADHPEMDRTEEELRERVAADAYAQRSRDDAGRSATPGGAAR